MKKYLMCFTLITIIITSSCTVYEARINPFRIRMTPGSMGGYEMNCDATKKTWWGGGKSKLVRWGGYPSIYQIVDACKKRKLKTDIILMYGNIWPNV